MANNSSITTLRIGTRKSPLALTQAHYVGNFIMSNVAHIKDFQIVSMDTAGDRNLDVPLMEIGGKGLFTAELEQQLLSGAIDIAVHSAKDMPTELPQGLEMDCFLEREDPRDAFISPDYKSIDNLPDGAIVGTASLRRKAQLLHYRNDLSVVTFRGNVQTRLRKLSEGQVVGTFLALSGLKRLDMAGVATELLEPDVMLPAPAQGALGIECARENEAVRAILAEVNHVETNLCVTAERALLATLDGSCRTPIAALARLKNANTLELSARVLSLDGQEMHQSQLSGSAQDPIGLGKAVGAELLAKGGAAFFERLRNISDNPVE